MNAAPALATWVPDPVRAEQIKVYTVARYGHTLTTNQICPTAPTAAN